MLEKNGTLRKVMVLPGTTAHFLIECKDMGWVHEWSSAKQGSFYIKKINVHANEKKILYFNNVNKS